MALATASGLAAQFHAIATICKQGDNLVTRSSLYGGTYNQFKVSLPRLGIDVRFCESDDPAEYEKLIDDKTKAIYVETLGNPKFDVPDFEGISVVAKKHKCVFICDNTFGCCGAICQPLKHGVDIVVESCTKV